MNNIGFISNDMALATKGYGVSAIPVHWVWDRQTIVLLCEDSSMIADIQSYIFKIRKPNSMYHGRIYSITGFVNLDYKTYEKDPANRNVRIVYCDMEYMKMEEVYDRFKGSYIIKVERSESNGTSRISRELPQVFS